MTVIIANRAKGRDYWEGYTEKPVEKALEYLAYFQGLGKIAKVFPDINVFREDCRKLLAFHEWKCKQTHGEIVAVSDFVLKLLDMQGWSINYHVSDGFSLHKSYQGKLRDIYTYRVMIKMGSTTGTIPGEFISCGLYAPKVLKSKKKEKIETLVSEWKTLRGAEDGIQGAHDKHLQGLRAKVGCLTPC